MKLLLVFVVSLLSFETISYANNQFLEQESFRWKERKHQIILPPHISHETKEYDLNKKVYAYLPYWIKTDEVHIEWELLSTLILFSVVSDGSGNIVNWHNWPRTDLIQQAHNNGVKVEVSVALFEGNQIATLLNSASNRATLITQLTDIITADNIDGIDIDFEQMYGTELNSFPVFMQELKNSITAVKSDATLTSALPSVDWANAYHYPKLSEILDGMLIMAYGYHYTGSPNAGPVSTLEGAIWGTFNIKWTLNDYKTIIDPAYHDKIILGLPTYGIKWPVQSHIINAKSTDTGSSITFADAYAEAAQYTRQWEIQSSNPYYNSTENGTLKQTWYDDGESFEAKFKVVNQENIGGIMLWALGYEGNLPDYWLAIAKNLAAEKSEPVDPNTDPDDSDTDNNADIDPDENTVTYQVGENSLYQDKFQASYNRVGGLSVLGTPTSSVTVWIPNDDISPEIQWFKTPDETKAIILYDIQKQPENAYSIFGKFFTYYIEIGRYHSFLGLPISEKAVNSRGLDFQAFENGIILIDNDQVLAIPNLGVELNKQHSVLKMNPLQVMILSLEIKNTGARIWLQDTISIKGSAKNEIDWKLSNAIFNHQTDITIDLDKPVEWEQTATIDLEITAPKKIGTSQVGITFLYNNQGQKEAFGDVSFPIEVVIGNISSSPSYPSSQGNSAKENNNPAFSCNDSQKHQPLSYVFAVLLICFIIRKIYSKKFLYRS